MDNIHLLMQEAIDCKKEFIAQSSNVKKAVDLIVNCFRKGNKILICGNGGSAADSQHIAAEFVGRYKRERKGLAAIALTTDTSILTAWANDYDYQTVFSRQVEALGNPGDIVIGLSTSGNSANVLKAFEEAKKKKIQCISFTGATGGKLNPLSEVCIQVPSENTPRVQECHMLAYHIICELVEEQLTQ